MMKLSLVVPISHTSFCAINEQNMLARFYQKIKSACVVGSGFLCAERAPHAMTTVAFMIEKWIIKIS